MQRQLDWRWLGRFDRLFFHRFLSHHPLSLPCKLVGPQGPIQRAVRFVERGTGTRLGSLAPTRTAPDRIQPVELRLDLPPLLFPRPGRSEFQIAVNGAFLGAALLEATPFSTVARQEAA